MTTSAQAQQALDPKPADSSLDSSTKIVAETPYAVSDRDGNQKIWSKVTWESNSLTGELTAKTNSFIELARGALPTPFVVLRNRIRLRRYDGIARKSAH